MARGSQVWERFEREAKAIAALSHPNVLTVDDGGADDDVADAITELLNGQTLEEVVKRSGRLDWRRALEIQMTLLDVHTSPYAWYRWQATLPLSPGKHQIWVRAVDALGRTQPMDGAIHWNPKGYTWNGVEKIDVVVG